MLPMIAGWCASQSLLGQLLAFSDTFLQHQSLMRIYGNLILQLKCKGLHQLASPVQPEAEEHRIVIVDRLMRSSIRATPTRPNGNEK